MNCWQRIEAVIGWAKMSTNGFARHIGLRRGENLYQIKRGNNGISLDVANRIVAKFPEVDKLWLLAGEGQMFTREHKESAEIARYKQALDEALEREKIQQKVITDLRRALQDMRDRVIIHDNDDFYKNPVKYIQFNRKAEFISRKGDTIVGYMDYETNLIACESMNGKSQIGFYCGDIVSFKYTK